MSKEIEEFEAQLNRQLSAIANAHQAAENFLGDVCHILSGYARDSLGAVTRLQNNLVTRLDYEINPTRPLAAGTPPPVNHGPVGYVPPPSGHAGNGGAPPYAAPPINPVTGQPYPPGHDPSMPNVARRPSHNSAH